MRGVPAAEELALVDGVDPDVDAKRAEREGFERRNGWYSETSLFALSSVLSGLRVFGTTRGASEWDKTGDLGAVSSWDVMKVREGAQRRWH